MRDDNALCVVVSFAAGGSPKVNNEGDGLVNIVDRHVEMDADLTRLRLWNGLKYQPWLRIATLAEVYPAIRRWAGLSTEQSAPEPRHTLRVKAVEGHTGPHACHTPTPRSLSHRNSRIPPHQRASSVGSLHDKCHIMLKQLFAKAVSKRRLNHGKRSSGPAHEV
jgi:hypothetical protein